MSINQQAYLKITFYLLALFILLNACKKDRAKPSWDVGLLLPLISDSITVDDILDDRFFVENPDQSISLVFNEALFSMNIDSLVKLPDTLLTFGVGLGFLPEPVQLQPGDTVISTQFFLPLDLDSEAVNGLLLEKVILSQGDIVFQSYNESNADLMVVLSIDQVWHPETGGFYSVEKVAKNELFEKGFDIAGYHLDLSGPDADTVNMLTYKVSLIIHPDEAGEVTISPEDSVALNVYFSDLIIDYSRGYFGHNTFGFGPETFPFDLFDDIDLKKLSFEDAAIKLQIENTYGLEVNFKVEEIKARNSLTGEELSLESPLLGTDLFVDRAIELEEESGNIVPHQTEFDFSESNFPEVFDIQPDEFSYRMSLETNVNQDSTNLNNFFYYDTPISIAVDAKVNGGITIDSLFESAVMEWTRVDVSAVKEGELHLVFSNAFPFDFEMSLYFEDEDHQIMATLVDQQFIASGELGEDNFVKTPQETRRSIPLTEALKKSMTEAKFSRYELYISSAQDQSIMIHRDNYLQFKVVGDFGYLLEQ